MKTLLEQAKEIGGKKNVADLKYSKEHFDLAIAWIEGEIGQAQFATVLNVLKNGAQPYIYLAKILRTAQKEGYIKITKLK